MTVTALPSAMPSSSAASFVIDEVIVASPSRRTFTVVVTAPASIAMTVPAS